MKTKAITPLLYYVVFNLFISLNGLSAISDTKQTILTSIYPVYVIAKNVSGDLFKVENLLPPGENPHEYQLKPEDVKKIQNADLIILNGLGIDDWLVETISRVNPEKNKTIRLITTNLSLIYISNDTSSKYRTIPDPHFWLDPTLMMQAASNLSGFLTELSPQKKIQIEQNLNSFCERLLNLDKKLKDELSAVKNKSIIFQHNAYEYFALRYGLEIVGYVEEVPGAPSSPQYLSRLIKNARKFKAAAVFGEPYGSNELVKRIAEELKIPYAVIDPLEIGNSDPEYYEQKMLENLNIIKNTLK
ncbi:MAG TPA: metal ABC transporter substrate-binding protein [Verrucomicrobiota bacterium]|nr:metal ABC transporter substrate-binding protein [Verrucomicrobiota bacterium]